MSSKSILIDYSLFRGEVMRADTAAIARHDAPNTIAHLTLILRDIAHRLGDKMAPSL